MTDGSNSLDEARRALQDSEVRLQQILDNTNALVFAKDSQGRYLFVNREFERITRRPAGEVLGRTDEMVFPSDVAARFRHNDLRVLRDGQAIEFEEVADFGKGTRTFLASKFPLLDAEGQAYAVCGIASDITERKQVVEALRDSEAQYRAIFNASEDALVLFDSSMRRVDVNPAFERMYGWTRDEVIGRGYADVALQDDLLTRQDNVRRALAGETTRCELDALRKDGERIQVEMITVPFRLRGEQHVLAIARDITERKRLESAFSSAALAVSQSEGEALFRELARYLAAILRVDAVFISTMDDADDCHMQVRAMQLDGRTVENFSYVLAGTPCETVVGQQFRFYPSRLRELFPADTDFRDLGFEAYAGHPLADATGRALGLLAVVSRQPLENPALVESVLRIFSVRVQAEIERLAARDALRASEASYREIFEASDDAIFVHDWDTAAVVDANPQACRAYGYTREELLSIRLADISSGVPPYTEAAGLRLIERAKREGSVRFEWQRRSRDGGLHWDEVRLKAATIGGRPRVLAFTREITERKEAEEALRASEEQYRTVFNASADALVLWNSRSERVDVNPAYERIYGYSRAEVLAGERAGDVGGEHHRLQADIVRHTLEGEPWCGEIETVRRGGEPFPIEVRTVPIRHRGEPHVLAMIRDLTDRRRVEEERAALEAQLRQAQRMEAIGQLTGGIAHDFNNLLTSIMGYVTLAGEREAAQTDRRLGSYLAQAQRSCERARDLIRQMLMFSRGQRGEPRTVVLRPLVEDTLAGVRPALPPAVALRMDLAPDSPAVRIDPLQFEQVLLNLCINARDACAGSAAGTIEVSTRSLQVRGGTCAGCRKRVEGEYVELTVSDSGHGMAPAVVERIFEPFFSTKTDGKGTGMGLAMVHGIVHEHGGHVLVETAPGAGSRFRVLWPVAPASADAAPAASSTAERRQQRARPALRGSVLVVDDEIAVGEFMREMLDTWGIDATFVPAPEAARELVAEAPTRFDAVITDQKMPRMTGLQLATALHFLRADLPVLVYSGNGDAIAQEELAGAGVRVLLRKPVEPAALEAALRAVLPSVAAAG